MQRLHYNCQVRYWEIKGSKTKEINDICFSGLKYPLTLPDKIKYEAPVDESLNRDIVDFYIKFLAIILDSNNYEYEFVSIKDEGERKKLFSNGTKINFTLKCQKLAKTKALLYLTAFRLISEFPEILIEFYQSKDKSNKETLFKEFQKCHVKYVRNEGNEIYKYSNLSGHGLIYDYYWHQKENVPTFITLKQFQAKLGDNNIRNVQEHFVPSA